MLWLMQTASAQSPMPPRPEPTVPEPTPRFSVRVLAESWEDGALGTVYRTGMVAPGFAANLPLMGRLALDLEAGYRKIKPRDETVDAALEVIPLAFTAEYSLVQRPSWSGFAGLGPSLVVFSERHPQNVAVGETEADTVRGARMALEARAGLRIDTGLFSGPTIPGMKGLGGLDVELLGARRFTRPGVAGLQLGAWRFGAGVAFRL